MASEHREILGVIDGIDGGGVARVLIGEAEEEWFFPLDLLADGVADGDGLRFAEQAGRYSFIGVVDPARDAPSIEDRLSRPLSNKKTAEFDRNELQLAKAQVGAEPASLTDPATLTDPAAPRSPARTRASRQRRW